MTFPPPFPRIPALRRRVPTAFTAFCDGALLLALALLLLPARPWFFLPAALLPVLPMWLNAARARRAAPKLFVPDPLAPDFAAFASAFAESAAVAALRDAGRQTWTLCPFRDATGAFVPYVLDFLPAKGEMRIGPRQAPRIVKTDLLIRPRLPFPVVVRDAPVTLALSPAPARRQVFLDAAPAFRLPWNRAGGNRLCVDVAKLWAALAAALCAVFPDAPFAVPERLFLLAAVAIFATFRAARGG